MEKTLVLIKPDAVEKNIIGRIISMYEDNGLVIEAMYKKQCEESIFAKHYAEHIHRDFYASLLKFMMSSPIVVLKVAGQGAVEKVRSLNGATNPLKCRPGTIRYIFGESVQVNTVHGSANLEDAKRELEIWFGPE